MSKHEIYFINKGEHQFTLNFSKLVEAALVCTAI